MGCFDSDDLEHCSPEVPTTLRGLDFQKGTERPATGLPGFVERRCFCSGVVKFELEKSAWVHGIDSEQRNSLLLPVQLTLLPARENGGMGVYVFDLICGWSRVGGARANQE